MTIEHFTIPASGVRADTLAELHAWSERVGFQFTIESNGSVRYLVRPPRRGVRVAHPGDTLIKYADGAFNHFQVPPGFALLPIAEPAPTKHAHYHRDVSHLKNIDFYRFCELFDVTHPCAQHAAKKILFAGVRGAKDTDKDVQEGIDTLVRWQAMRAEDAAK